MIFHLIRWAFKLAFLLVAIVVVYFVVTGVQVWLTSRHYAPRHASAIVVMGAAQYDGVPSPDLAARLNEALLLYHQGYAHTIVVTGYKQQGDQFTEAEAGAKYLEYHGVPAKDILQAGGTTSWSNLSGAVPELKARGDDTVLVVTDPFHEDMSMAIVSTMGLQPYPTPTQTSPIRGWSTVPYFVKETFGVGVGRIIGFNNLNRIHNGVG